MRVFYSKTGISRGTLESSSGITEETLAKFIAIYPDVSITWLILGEGDMLNSYKSGSGKQKCSKCEKNEMVMADLNDTIKSLNKLIHMQESELQKMKFRKPYVIPEDTPPIAAEPTQKLTKK